MARREKDHIAGRQMSSPGASRNSGADADPFSGSGKRRRRLVEATHAGDGFGSTVVLPEGGVAASMARASHRATYQPRIPGALLSFVARPAIPSVAPAILAFATGETADSVGGRSCAKLYLLLQGKVIPLQDTISGLDPTRREWWVQAMAEFAAGRWGGTAQGTQAIAAAQPHLWEQAQAAAKALKRQGVQVSRLWDP